VSDTVETLKQWAIKAISSRVIEEITEAARVSVPKVSVGQLVEQMWDHWKQDGQPAVVAATESEDSRSDDLDRVERAVRTAVLLAGSNAVPETFRKRANRRLLAALPSPVKQQSTKVKVTMLEGPMQKV
jgi:hypothetical protein